jgi:Uncharacterized conserved protein
VKTKKYFELLTHDIHSTVFGTIDENGEPHTCVIDIMLCDDDSIYFLTSTGKPFYDRLKNQNFVSITGMKGNDTLSTVVVSIRGKIREVGNSLVNRVFEENKYMKKIYPKEKSRDILTVFQMYAGEGEYFDLRQQPPFRDNFTFGGWQSSQIGYVINDSCIQCGDCLISCPANCIETGRPFHIRTENCIHCGNCYIACKYSSVKKMW